MESILKNNILEYLPETVLTLRKQYDLEKPGRMEEAINILEDWIQKQPHFLKKDFSRNYLEKMIIFSKGSVERAKSRMDKSCSMRTQMSNFFQVKDPRIEFQNSFEHMTVAVLPKMTEDFCRVFVVKIYAKPFDAQAMPDHVKYALMMCEYLTALDYSNNTIIILDLEVNIMDFMTSVNPLDMQQGMALLMDCLGRRIKGLHILTTSKAVETVVKLFKSLFPAKIGNRIRVHRSVDSMHEHIPKEVLPVCYGGDQNITLEGLHESWLEVLSSKEMTDYLKEMNKAGTDESLRPSNGTNADQSSLPGSFRNLSVD